MPKGSVRDDRRPQSWRPWKLKPKGYAERAPTPRRRNRKEPETKVSQTASSAAVLISITNGDLVTAGMPTGTRFRIISIRSWNSTSSGQSSGFVSINWDETTTYTGVGQVVMSDTGSATSLPGVGIALPKALSKIETAATSSASNLISVRSAQVGVDVPAAQNLILDFECEIAV
jgi:ribosomal protein S30